jgi:ABC-type multidrug transport system fused ATPase/permease subunit
MNVLEKINAILSRKERRQARKQLFLMTIGMFLEMLGVGVIIPLVALLTQENALQSIPFAEFMEGRTQTDLVFGVMTGLILVYLIKNLFLVFLLWKQSGFAYDIQVQLSQRLFFTYLRQPYAFHLQQNSAQLIRNVTVEVNFFTSRVLMQGLQLVTEGMVVIGLTVLLLLIEPMGTLLVGLILAFTVMLFFRVTRGLVLNWGSKRQFHEGLCLQHLQQGLGGIKDVILMGRETMFLSQYGRHNTLVAVAARWHEFLAQIPRLALEWLAVFGLALLVMSMVSQGRELVDVAPVIGAFAAAAFRLMPSINRILGGVQMVRYMVPVINTLYQQSRLPVREHATTGLASLDFVQEIRVDAVHFSYHAVGSPTLHDISLTIKKGQTIGFIGTSGSGKSTLIDVILGLLEPEQGRVLVDGRDIRNNLREWQAMIGYVPQSIYLTDDTLRRNIAFGMLDNQIDESAVLAAIQAAQLDRFVESLPDGLSTVVGERGVRLSGGQRQRIGIARALYRNPAVLVLDEASSALDSNTEHSVMEAVDALHGEKTILIVAHRLSTVEKCDRLFRLEDGRLVS